MTLYHPVTQAQIERFAAQPSHALLLLGKTGTGKSHLAEEISLALLSLSNREELVRYSFMKRLQPAKGSISVENVRDLQGFMRLKTLGIKPIRRIAIIENADTMTMEAQNAFLKVLEEPPADTVLILTAASKTTLLPTTLSRTQHIVVRAPKHEDAIEHFAALGYDHAAIERVLHVSGRLPGLTSALLNDEGEHGLLSSINDAKQILRANAYERLLLADRLSKDRDGTALLLEALSRVVRAVMVAGLEKNQASQSKKMVSLLRRIQLAQQQLSHNVQPKLVLTNLFLRV